MSSVWSTFDHATVIAEPASLQAAAFRTRVADETDRDRAWVRTPAAVGRVRLGYGQRTRTVTRWTAVLRYPPTFHSGSRGWVRPVESVARQQRTCSPGSARQSNDHARHPNADAGSGPRIASIQVTPSSVLTSTRSIRPNPDQARPSSRCVPGSATLARVANSGIPGGIMRLRGKILVIGSPAAPGAPRLPPPRSPPLSPSRAGG